MTDWVTVTLVLREDELDEASGLIWDLGAAGIEENDCSDGMIELRIGCEAGRADAISVALSGRWAPQMNAVSADSGLDAWRDYAQVWRAGPQVVVVPPWLDAPADVTDTNLVLFIDPAHSFGSASHETTRLCLAAVAELVQPGMRVADIGCGSGVLSIAAARCGASVVVATDTSPEAIIATIDNARRNGVEELIEVSTTPPEDFDAGSFDLVLANIGAATLCSMAEGLGTMTRPLGTLVLSGALTEQVEDVVSAFVHAGVTLDEARIDGEWTALLMHRRASI